MLDLREAAAIFLSLYSDQTLDRLPYTRKTVKNHLGDALRKLDISRDLRYEKNLDHLREQIEKMLGMKPALKVDNALSSWTKESRRIWKDEEEIDSDF